MGRKTNDIEKRILRLISKSRFGVTIEDVSNFLKINRATASKYLAILEATEKILVREVGKAKFHYPKTRSVEEWLRQLER